MALEAGTRLGHYEVVSSLGVGGMGEVYRAKDTKLGREVAVKLLLDEVSADPERLARFEREARVLASLNHKNIASLHAFEREGDTGFLVMELVEGETLADRIKRGAVSVDEALPVFLQIAEGLEAAHEKGVIHRDLKPANIKVTDDGQVKILDFGLAKAMAVEASESGDDGLSESPTLTLAATQRGQILGTAAYMAPEQARGKTVDKRADVWAFGVCLFEALSGKRVFAAEDASLTLAAVLRAELQWDELPTTPRAIQRLLHRCLKREPTERLRDIGDARIEIEEARQELASGPADSGRSHARARASGPDRLAWGLAAVLAVVTAGLVVRSLLPGGPTRGPLQLSVPLAPAQLDGGVFAVSPDGSQVVFSGREEGGVRRLYVRTLGDSTAHGLPGTEDASGGSLFFSPDGQWVAFFSGNPPQALKKVLANGGPVVTVAEGNFRSSNGTWTDDGWIVVTPGGVSQPGELLRVRAEGGALEPLKVSAAAAQEFVSNVSKVSGSRALLLGVVAGPGNSDDVAVAIQSFETGERRVLAPGGGSPRHLATGHIVYTHAGRLMAGRLDAEAMQLVGTPVPLQAVTGEEDVAYFDVSPSGVLVFTSSSVVEEQQARLAWTDRAGSTTPLPFDVSGYEPRLSPDGTRVTIDERGPGDVWVWDLDRGTTTRISSAPGTDETGTWSPDGRWIAWAGSRVGQKPALYRRRSDGSGPEERLWSDERHFHVASWSSAGIVVTVSDPTTGWDVLVLDPDDPSEARPLLNATFNESSARVSPDGRLVAFVSDETGRDEVYVQAFPESRAKVQVSIDGGVQPVWRPGAREIVYRGSGKIMSVTLGPGDPPTAPAPHALFDDRFADLSSADHTAYAVHRDGRLLAFEAPERLSRPDIRIVLDWMEAAGLRP